MRPALSTKLGRERKMKRSTEAYPRMLSNQQLHVKNYSRPGREKSKDLEVKSTQNSHKAANNACSQKPEWKT